MRVNPAVLKRERRVKFFSFVLVLASSLAFMLMVRDIFISFLLAVLLVYVMKPGVNWLERVGLSRSLAITALFVFVSLVFTGLGYALAPMVSNQVVSFQADLPRYSSAIQTMVLRIQDQINTRVGDFYQVNLIDSIGLYSQKYFLSYLEKLPEFASDFFTVTLLAPFFAFFMLRDGRTISRWLLSLVPNNLFEIALSLSNEINEQIGGFIRARILEALIVGLVVLAGLWIVQFPYAVILSIFAAATNLIPYVGPFIGAIPALVVATVDQSGSSMVLIVSLIYFVAQVIDMVFIIPLVVAKIVNLHPILVVLAIIAGAEIAGVLGMIISIPVTSALKLIFSTIYTQLLAQRTDL